MPRFEKVQVPSPASMGRAPSKRAAGDSGSSPLTSPRISSRPVLVVKISWSSTAPRTGRRNGATAALKQCILH